ncbi:hypothetical protein [Photobacterium alginatilyticum]|uniref:Uncharacterized protein n=1 Tax=Photobacterium alginatilyticum TaxID=1775171 RepID=A0ABW9YE95_9GAMM|nr:hypothetical protein [Photobacterium alginatilyticum]NBI52110.1 hypothetical protein [Photobacterium alginatilyticum]
MPCEQFTASQLAGMTVEEQKTFSTSCSVINDSPPDSYVPAERQQTQQAWKPESKTESDFWDDWQGNNGSPVVSSKSKSNSQFFGLGVWVPAKYEDPDIESMRDAEEWIKNHGLQMSFGVGGEDGRSTRVRVDYRWHGENLDDISLQVEIPFQ